MLGIGFIALDANEIAAQLLGHGTCGACAKERVQHHVT